MSGYADMHVAMPGYSGIFNQFFRASKELGPNLVPSRKALPVASDARLRAYGFRLLVNSRMLYR